MRKIHYDYFLSKLIKNIINFEEKKISKCIILPRRTLEEGIIFWNPPRLLDLMSLSEENRDVSGNSR